jgi:hypothetical protein
VKIALCRQYMADLDLCEVLGFVWMFGIAAPAFRGRI